MDATDSDPTVSFHRSLTCSPRAESRPDSAERKRSYFSQTGVTFSVDYDPDIGSIGRTACQLLDRVHLQHALGLLKHGGL